MGLAMMRGLFFASVVSATSLVGALAAGVLCDALICEPARADYYAFGSTRTSGNAVLELDVDGTWENLTTLGVQGWISGGDHGTGGPYGTNPSYTAGFYQGNYYNDYFGFNLAALDLPTDATITAANLVVYSGTISNNLTYNLYGMTTGTLSCNGVTTDMLSCIEKGSPDSTLYDAMTTGTSYGTFQLSETSTSHQLVFSLDQA